MPHLADTLESRMILRSFICEQFGFDNFRAMLDKITDVPAEERDGAESRFAQIIGAHLSANSRATQADLSRYDNNISEYSHKMGMDAPGKSWKPFQYLAMLFTERYLDLYFHDADALCDSLNEFKREIRSWREIANYQKEDLSTLAFQSATGSGKTLLLHANILQYLRYVQQHGQSERLNRVILLTPDEQMSRQHLRELEESNISARLFTQQESKLFGHSSNIVDIIDIHKLDEKQGIKRVAVEAFEENNLVMVDEGHLGTRGTKWRELRRRLIKNGFCFEYSATFNQAVTGNNNEIRQLRDDYGKCLLFDYSYKYFYNDGYGKDYKISNLRQDENEETSNLYLLACLLTFYQQCHIYEGEQGQWKEYNLAPPLWVFLGKTVIGSSNGDKTTQTDVVRIVKFLAWALAEHKDVKAGIKRLLSNNTGLISVDDKDLFAGAFTTLENTTPAKIYEDICKVVFRGNGQLRVKHLTGADELHLTASDGEPFGVINVGNASKLYSLLDSEPHEYFTLAKDNFSPPLFDSVDKERSPINIAIGARRFVAGWNSWRVSTMGLMHVGAGEGPQIIQMFGRGVRLKGRDMTLKRHSHLSGEKPADGSQLKLLETLNIFGLRANYMEQFKKYLAEAEVTTQTIEMPVTKNFGKVKGLKVLRLIDGARYEYSDNPLVLPAPSKTDINIRVDLYPKLQSLISEGIREDGAQERSAATFKASHRTLMNKQRIYYRLLENKAQKNWHNLHIPRETVEAMIDKDGWYELLTPHEKMGFTDYARVVEWEDIMTDLITRYADQFWQKQRREWEKGRLKLVELKNDDPNYFDNYQISVNAKEEALIDSIKEMVQKAGKGLDAGVTELRILTTNRHAYQPLLWRPKAGGDIKVSPVALNDGEGRMVEYIITAADLQTFKDVKIYLMRNLSIGRGVSLFGDYSFYPDFILWMLEGGRQHIVFIDPKGLVHFDSQTTDKVRLHSSIKETQEKIQKKHADIFLHSYIWSVTLPRDIGSAGKVMTRESCHGEGIYLSKYGIGEMESMLQHALKNCHPG
ncbi:MAG: DEAD/DEAH box helicase family protein [Pseudohongiellaceae bacterium]